MMHAKPAGCADFAGVFVTGLAIMKLELPK